MTLRDILQDQHITFDCYQFSRGVKAGRPMSRRWVSVEQCLCTLDDQTICDANRLYSISFYETSDDEEAKNRQDLSEQYPHIPADRIGVFNPNKETSVVCVPTDFMDTLWVAALAADGVLRSISLTVQPQDDDRWAVFEATLHEKIAEPFEVPVDKQLRPKALAPRADAAVIEMRAVRALFNRLVWSGAAAVAAGLLAAFWIAYLAH